MKQGLMNNRINNNKNNKTNGTYNNNNNNIKQIDYTLKIFDK